MRKYFVWIDKEDSIVVSVKDDVNRPNNPDCESVLEEYLHLNYGSRKYSYTEIDSCEHISI